MIDATHPLEFIATDSGYGYHVLVRQILPPKPGAIKPRVASFGTIQMGYDLWYAIEAILARGSVALEPGSIRINRSANRRPLHAPDPNSNTSKKKARKLKEFTDRVEKNIVRGRAS